MDLVSTHLPGPGHPQTPLSKGLLPAFQLVWSGLCCENSNPIPKLLFFLSVTGVGMKGSLIASLLRKKQETSVRTQKASKEHCSLQNVFVKVKCLNRPNTCPSCPCEINLTQTKILHTLSWNTMRLISEWTRIGSCSYSSVISKLIAILQHITQHVSRRMSHYFQWNLLLNKSA